jgi:hypothetical protein
MNSSIIRLTPTFVAAAAIIICIASTGVAEE